MGSSARKGHANTNLKLSLSPSLSLPRAGLLATQGIRGGDNRTVLERIKNRCHPLATPANPADNLLYAIFTRGSMTATLTPAAFAAKWIRAALSERAASQEHFIDLCRLLGQPTPAEHDATGAEYTFEKGIAITAASTTAKKEGGFADVWWNGKFGWEYKRQGKYKNLSEAYAQLQRYREALNNPPLLIVCDIARIEIHTNFNNTANETHTVTLDDIAAGSGIGMLRRIFTAPESFRPAKTTEQVTLDVAQDIGNIAQRLQKAGNDPHAVAHYLMKCMFCLFAEKVPGLLPDGLFKNLLNRNRQKPKEFTSLARELFTKMATGGNFGLDTIPYFNGGLFNDDHSVELTEDDLGVLVLAANRDWTHIEPSILGTLFERSLDPTKRAQIGAHYTSKEDILLVINPVIMAPLRQEWQKLKSQIESELAKGTGSVSARQGAAPQDTTVLAQAHKTTSHKITPPNKPANPLTTIHQQIATFLTSLSSLKILDPACGSGNFLYVAIQELLKLEKEIITFAAQPPISLRLLPRIRPTQLLGIEINPYAAELAQVSIWIGFLQWLHLNGFPVATDTPILSKIQTIENRDAILDFRNAGVPPAVPHQSRTRKEATEQSRDHKEATVTASRLATPAQWPDAHFIVGNPPFLGSKVFRSNGLPDDYVSAMYKAYDLPKTSDLCCYWFELARRKIEAAHPNSGPEDRQKSSSARKDRDQSPQDSPSPGGATPSRVANANINLKFSLFPSLSLPRVGLLATQGIRGGDNRTVLERIKESGDIFLAWSDKEWVLDGAMVHTSIIGFEREIPKYRELNGTEVIEINADLSTNSDLTKTYPLAEHIYNPIWSIGTQKGGSFDFTYEFARKLLAQPNPHGRSNFEVVRPWRNAADVTGRLRGMWVVDFGPERPLSEASLFEKPLEYIRKHVKRERDHNRRDSYRLKWWIHEEPRAELRSVLNSPLILLTPRVSKYRLWTRSESTILPDCALVVFSRSDDFFFGTLHSFIHELWARRKGTQLREAESGFRYTPSTCFETFPLPWPPGKEKTQHPAYKRIAAAATELNSLRERWLNPPELLKPLIQIIDANDKFLDVPKEARALIRHSAIMAAAAQSPNLKKRTLTNLYNQRPTWLKLAHEKLDRAVLAAYAAIDPAGNWSEDWAALYTETGAGQPLPPTHPQAVERAATDQKILANLLRLNHQRAAAS